MKCLEWWRNRQFCNVTPGINKDLLLGCTCIYQRKKGEMATVTSACIVLLIWFMLPVLWNSMETVWWQNWADSGAGWAKCVAGWAERVPTCIMWCREQKMEQEVQIFSITIYKMCPNFAFKNGYEQKCGKDFHFILILFCSSRSSVLPMFECMWWQDRCSCRLSSQRVAGPHPPKG